MSSTALEALQLGDTVTIKRNLDHPAWMREVPQDPRNGGSTRRVRNDSVEEVIGRTTVTERRDNRVRIGNSFWYVLNGAEAGYQEHSGATLIEPAAR